jgi:hypothetical protein
MNVSNLPEFLEEATAFIRKLNTMWNFGSIGLKEDLQKLVFAKKLRHSGRKEKRDKLSYRLLVPLCGL